MKSDTTKINKKGQGKQKQVRSEKKADFRSLNAVVVLPTYNEKDNIETIIKQIFLKQAYVPDTLIQILVVDDSSPDNTSGIVKKMMRDFPHLHLLSGKKEGLGVAYKRGMKHAIDILKADMVFEMDADMSHDPALIKDFVKAIKDGNDFVIGSRYVKGGSIPNNWPLMRKMNSIGGNVVARFIAGLYGVKDCTSGYRAIKADFLRQINLNQLNAKGYAFQINLLYEAYKRKGKIKEIPLKFKDREKGESKIRLDDVFEFILFCMQLRMETLLSGKSLVTILAIALLTLVTVVGYTLTQLPFIDALTYSLVSISLILVAQGLFSLYSTLYTWEEPSRVYTNKSPRKFAKAKYSFTALLPALHEEEVIAHTIEAVSSIKYPEHLKETIVLTRSDDTETIAAAQAAIQKLVAKGKNVRLVTISDTPINKPYKLNIGLQESKNDVVCIFDAEDEPHKDIYNIVNTVMIRKNADVVQCGVQLMNFASHWFSSLNVLEYYFWFKSALRYFAKIGLITLGGNTVFFKREWITKIGGWDASCLTEDADVGIRLSMAGAQIEVLYDQEHATQEETPHNLENFIKQRTRWNQGFIQVLFKGTWLQLPKFSQKFLAFYLLFWPIVQAFLFMYIPASLVMMFVVKLPVWATIITILPVYMLMLQLIVIIVAFFEFVKDYKLKYHKLFPLQILVWYFPYQFILGLSAYRAVYRILSKQASWEKTKHINAHRKVLALTNN